MNLEELALKIFNKRYQLKHTKIDTYKIKDFCDQFLAILYPVRDFNRASDFESLNQKLIKLRNQLEEFLHSIELGPDHPTMDVTNLCKTFFESLDSLTSLIDSDARAILKGDPAAKSLDEVVLCYPGFYAIAIYRIAHFFYKQNVPLLPRLLTEYAHEKTAIDIHPGANINESFFIDHGTGVVIGETCIIGKNVKIYQGVTLGALSVEKDLQNTKRHPTIEDNVIIYANATILGGKTIIGKGAIIGGNTWITESVSDAAKIYR